MSKLKPSGVPTPDLAPPVVGDPPPSEAQTPSTGGSNPSPARRAIKPLTWKQKAGLIVFGLLLVHAGLEALLRAAGFVYFHEAEHKASHHPDSAFVIMAVGDSVTYGYASSDPRRFSYPAQLQKLLQKYAPGQDIRVERMGFPGANSSQIARRLEGFFALHKPDLLILLIGNNDLWNLNETRADLFASKAGWADRARIQIALALEHVRVFRLYKWVWLFFSDRRERAGKFNAMEDAFPSQKQHEDGLRFFGSMENVQRLYEHNFGQMLELARRQGARVIVLDYHNDSRLKESELIRPALEKLGQPMLDLRPRFREARQKGLQVIVSKGWHPNDHGYALIARIVFNELVRLGIVQSEPIEPVVDSALKPLP